MTTYGSVVARRSSSAPRRSPSCATVADVVRRYDLPVLVDRSRFEPARSPMPVSPEWRSALSEWADGIEIDGVEVRAGSAVALPVLARRTAAAGLTGFEWAVGVPGSIGGAVRMNAGGHGSDIAACLVRAEIFDIRARRIGLATHAVARPALPRLESR